MHRTSPPASPNTKTDPTTYKLNGIDFERTVATPVRPDRPESDGSRPTPNLCHLGLVNVQAG
jgi:hypothetical protein